MRILFFIIGLTYLLNVFAQKEIIVIDYRTLMVSADSEGELHSTASLKGNQQAGFFLHSVPQGTMKICSSGELFIWVNGKLFDVINQCDFFDPHELFAKAKSDTLFVSFSSESSLVNLRCELVLFEEPLTTKAPVSNPREVRNEFDEFIIIVLLILLLCLGIIISTRPSMISNVIKAFFTRTASTYEFMDTHFFGRVSMYVLGFYSLTLAFVGIYLDSLIQYGLFTHQNTLTGFLWSWLQASLAISLLFILKGILVSLISELFRFSHLKRFQSFAVLNFNLVLLMPFLFFLVLDFFFNPVSQTWISSSFIMFFPATLILSVIWLILMVVNTSSHKKLSIISYLCVTEIIPVVILLGWLFK